MVIIMKIKINLILGMLLCICLARCGDSAAAPAKPLELHMSIGNTAISDNAEKYAIFCDAVGEISSGLLTVKLYTDGTLASDAEALNAILDGTVDFIHLTPSVAVAAIPNLACMSTFGILKYDSLDDVTTWPAWAANIHDVLGDIYAAANIKYIGMNPMVSSVIVCNDTLITEPSQLQGKIFRSQGTWTSKVLESWGAATANIAISELPSALERNTVQGAMLAYGAACSWKLYEVAPNVTWMLYNGEISTLAMNMDAWNSLNTEQQGWIEQAAERFSKEAPVVANKWFHTYYSDVEASGSNMITLSIEQNEAVRAMLGPVMEQLRKGCDEKGIKLMNLIEEWEAVH
jgi:TRAP-type C4-dicarboxylate transport system substrate-binding protein